MAVSTTLSTWLHSDALGAQRTTRRLSAAALTCPSLDDVAAVSWPVDRPRPLAWQSRDLATTTALAGAFWGLLFAQLFLLPLSMQTPPPLTSDGIDDALGCLGVDAEFVRLVRGAVVPGRSAVFVVTSSAPDPVLERHLADAVDITRVRLSAEQSERLHAGFDDA